MQLEAINNTKITEFFINSQDKTPNTKLKPVDEEMKESEMSFSKDELHNLVSDSPEEE